MADSASGTEQLRLDLQRACRHGTWKSVSDALGKGASLAWTDEDNNTSLHYAATGNNLEVIKKMYEEDKEVYLSCLLRRAEPEGNTPLLMACALGHSDLVAVFLGQSPEVCSVSNKKGESPLHVATAYNRPAVVSLLLEQRACHVDAVDHRQSTPLDRAIVQGHVSIALMLIDHGADLRCKNYVGANALCQSIHREQWQIMERILQEPDPDINGGTRVNVTALHLATCKKTADVVDLLLDLGADPNTADTRNRFTPLHSASSHGALPIIRSLVEAGADMAAVTNTGDTALGLAAMRGHTEAVQFFLKRGAKVYQVDARDPISQANLHDHPETANVMMRYIFKRYLR